MWSPHIDWDAPLWSMDVETGGLHAHRGARPFLLGMAGEDGDVHICEPYTKKWRTCVSMIEDPEVAKVAHNLKFELKMLAQMGVKVRGTLHDTMIMAHTRNEYEPSFKLERLTERYIGQSTQNASTIEDWKRANKARFKERIGREPRYFEIPDNMVRPYLDDDVVSCLKLFWVFKKLIKEAFSELYTWEMALVPVLAAIEERGIHVDMKYITQKRGQYLVEMADLLLKVRSEAGDEKFNPLSPKQIVDKLVDFGVEFSSADYTEKGNPKTDYDTLQKYDTPFTNAITAYRKLSKLKGTYFDALARFQNGSAVHCSLWQCSSSKDKGLRTARLSSSDPNLQNIPARDSITVRRAFVPRPRCSLWFLDFHQIEMVLFADVFGVEGMIRAIEEGEDLHAFTAREILGYSRKKWEALKKTDEATYTKYRFLGKQCNFAVVYGAGDRKFHQTVTKQLKGDAPSFRECKELRVLYKRRFPEIPQGFRRMEGQLVSCGYVEDRMGRRYHVPRELSYKAVNAVIQGEAATIMKRALVKVHRYVGKEWAKFQQEVPFDSAVVAPGINLTVHDEVVLECDDVMAPELPMGCAKVMAFKEYRLPVEVEVSWVPESWADKRKASEFRPGGRCVACGGTGRNSKGGPCLPCEARKGVKQCQTA